MSELLTRRRLLWGVGGLAVAVALPQLKSVAQRVRGQLPNNPNAYIHIGSDDTVTFLIVKGEMGQGILTALSQILADELDCDWAKIRTEFAPVNPDAYGPMQGVYGSTSIRTMWAPMRKAGATARLMLIQAAGEKWKVDLAQLRTENGFVLGPTTAMRASYGSLADAAMQVPVPANVTPKHPKAFKLIGTSAKRLDTRNKVSGATKFGIDAHSRNALRGD